MAAIVSEFGFLPDGRRASTYRLQNRRGSWLTLCDYGASILEVGVPDVNGVRANCALRLPDFNSYLHHDFYCGATIGRVAGRIRNAQIEIEGQAYALSANEGLHHLHGGLPSLSHRLWRVEQPDEAANQIGFTLDSPDGDAGYPGHVKIEVVFTLTETDCVRIDYSAHTDQPTPFSPTNHVYLNLSGGESPTIAGHVLQISADAFVPTDASLALQGKSVSVTGLENDFRAARSLKSSINGALKTHGDHYFINGKKGHLRAAAKLRDPVSGRQVDVWTTASSLQLYTGKFLNQGTPDLFAAFAGMCLECQEFSDALRHPQLDHILITPEEPYMQRTEYRFSADVSF